MKKIDLVQSVTILANLGVIAGIFFLVFELQQNTQAVRLSSAQSYLTGGNTLDFHIASNPEFAGLLIADDNGVELTDAQSLQLDRWNYAVLRQWETAHYLQSIGALDDELWMAYRQEIKKILLRSAGLQRYWMSGADSFTLAFRSFIDGLLKAKPAWPATTEFGRLSCCQIQARVENDGQHQNFYRDWRCWCVGPDWVDFGRRRRGGLCE
jgi:hypothetical protein